MIKVTSANNNEDYFINHNKIRTLKVVNSYVHIVLDNESRLIVTDSITDIQNRIIEFENAIIYSNKIKPSIIEEVSINE